MKSIFRSHHFHALIALAVGLVLYHFGQAEAAMGAMLIGATLPSKAGAVTLFDIAQGMDPDGKVARTINLLSQTNEMLTDMTWMEGNLPTGHKSSILTGLPVPVWRRLYQGVPPSKATRASVTDSLGMLEARAEVDTKAYELNGNSAAWRLAQNGPFMEAMNQNMAETVIYGDAMVNPERFNGFAPRFGAISGAGNGGNIIDAGGVSTDNTSVWLVVWGENTVTGIYPKGSDSVGLQHRDLGEIDAFDENNNRYRALADLWQWDAGLVVSDWRYIVRIANIDVSDLIAQTGTQAQTAATALAKLMIRAQALIPNPGAGRAAFYANRTVKSLLQVAALDRSQNALSIQASANQFGNVAPGGVRNDLMFFGTPIRTVDRILNTEARIV
jgi:hypothetical protein